MPHVEYTVIHIRVRENIGSKEFSLLAANSCKVADVALNNSSLTNCKLGNF